MRKTLLMLLMLLVGTIAKAQFNQGRMMVGGTIGLNFNSSKYKSDGDKSDGPTNYSYSLLPSFGYFVVDNLAFGVSLANTISGYKPEDTDYIKSSNSFGFGVHPFVRYYLPMRLFFHGSYGFGLSKYHVDYTDIEDTDTRYKYSSWGLATGYAIMLNNNVAIEPMFGYNHYSDKNKDSDVKSLDTGFSLRASIQVYLGRD